MHVRNLLLGTALLASTAFGQSAPPTTSTATTPSTTTPPAAQTAAAEPAPTGTPAQQLAAAQKQLSILKLRHDEKHPAVLKQRAKVARLQKEARDEEKKNAPKDASGQLAVLKEELAEVRKKYTDQHPQVKALERRIAELERQR